MAGLFADLFGTTKAFFRVGLTGPRLKNTGGNLAVRNSGDTADVEVTASKLNVSGDSIDLNSDAAGAGNDFKLTLQRNAAQTSGLTLVAPVGKSTDGYLVRQKAGTAPGVLELELVAPTGTASQLTVETTSLAFGAGATTAMFTKSATAVIDRIQVVVDTPFNGTPSASVGITGTASKYAASADFDLTAAAGTVFEIHPGLGAAGAGEDLIITYAGGGATAGAARFIVFYADAPV